MQARLADRLMRVITYEMGISRQLSAGVDSYRANLKSK